MHRQLSGRASGGWCSEAVLSFVSVSSAPPLRHPRPREAIGVFPVSHVVVKLRGANALTESIGSNNRQSREPSGLCHSHMNMSRSPAGCSATSEAL